MNMMRKLWFPKTGNLLNMNEKAVYFYMEDSWKRNGRKPFTALISEMADGMGVSKSSVKRVVKSLREHNVIESMQVATGNGSGHSQSLYTLITYLTSDSDDRPNFLEDGSLLLDRTDVDLLFGTPDLRYSDGTEIDEKDIPY